MNSTNPHPRPRLRRAAGTLLLLLLVSVSCSTPPRRDPESPIDSQDTTGAPNESAEVPLPDPSRGPPAVAPEAVAPDSPPPPVADRRRVVREGIAVELEIFPAGADPESEPELVEGDIVRVQFRITDTATGTPATTLEPAAWMHPVVEGALIEPLDCKTKVSSFLSGSLSARAEIDLNVFYVLTLNDEASISVVDPLFSFGGSKLLEMVLLRSAGQDWALSADENWLYVSMPGVAQVAVVDTSSWEVVKNIDVGPNPGRVRLQPDGHYLWVGIDGTTPADPRSGVTLIDAERKERVTSIPTGGGHHEIAFTDDSRHAFVTNQSDGTLSILDIRTLKLVRDLPCGRKPVSVAFSTLGQAAYVVSEEDGTILVVDGRDHEVLTRIEAEPGLGTLKFTPDGRLGFVVNSRENVVQILDPAVQRIIQTGDVGPGPDQLAFTENIAYVRSRGSEIVLMVPLDQVGQEGAPVPIIDFTGGQIPFGESDRASIADGIVPAPGGTSVLVANPMDRAIYYYREGMAAPMGQFQNYKRQPRAVLVVDRSLREKEPGVYGTDVKLTRGGRFDVPFFLDSPRIIHCFSVDVTPNPDEARRNVSEAPPLKIEPLLGDGSVPAGEEVTLRLRVTDPKTKKPRPGLRDLMVLAFSTGSWQRRLLAKPVGDGIYEVPFKLPRAGVYFLSFQCRSLNVRLNQLPPVTVQAVGEG